MSNEPSHAATCPATEITNLQPPKFLVYDPDYVELAASSETVKNILLPDGDGGVTVVSESVVKICHRGQRIELRKLPPAQKRLRQRIINVMSILLGILFLWLFFWFML